MSLGGAKPVMIIRLISVFALGFLLAACGGSSPQQSATPLSFASSSTDYSRQVQEMYVAYYGRPADPGGQAYWAGRIAEAGGNLSAIIQEFGASEEAQALYGALPPAQAITALYRQLFNRDPDPEGLKYYQEGLAAGRFTLVSVAADIFYGASSASLDGQGLQQKLKLAQAFTNQVDASALTTYSGNAAARSARSLLAQVTDTPTSLALAEVTLTSVLARTTPTQASAVLKEQKSAFSDACENPSIQFVLPVALSDDQHSDFVVHLWCDQSEVGLEVSAPTRDALIAYVSKGDGTYSLERETVFGDAQAKLGGASRKVVRGDLNGDGIDDFAFAMNWEDGRSGTDPKTNATQPSVLLSGPGGQYRVHRMGRPNWGHSVGLVDNTAGGKDVLFAGFTDSLQAFRFKDGAWLDVSADYPVNQASAWGGSFKPISKSGTETASPYIVGAANKTDPNSSEYRVLESGLQLFTRANAGWAISDSYFQKVDFNVTWTSWQNTPGPVTVTTINGKRYLGGAFDDLCEVPKLSNSETGRVIAAKMNAQASRTGEAIVEGGTYKQTNFTPINTFVFFRIVSGKLIQIPTPIVDEEINRNFNFFDCKDINGDGLSDLVAYAFTRLGFNEGAQDGGKPLVYLNDGAGKLRRFDITKLPMHGTMNKGGPELQATGGDFNGDGFWDLALFGSTAHRGGGDIELFYLPGHIDYLLGP